MISLNIFGISTHAKITSYRQEYGERNETIRNQYTYVYGYEFDVNGNIYSGNGQRISNSVYLKSNNNQMIVVKYLKCCPYFNHSYESESNVKSIVIFLFLSLLLLFYFTIKIK